jgi:hypothetical protein
LSDCPRVRLTEELRNLGPAVVETAVYDNDGLVRPELSQKVFNVGVAYYKFLEIRPVGLIEKVGVARLNQYGFIPIRLRAFPTAIRIEEFVYATRDEVRL